MAEIVSTMERERKEVKEDEERVEGNKGNEGNESKDKTGGDGGDGGHDRDYGGVGGYDIAAFGFQESVRSVGPALAACIDLTEWVLLKAEAMGEIRMYVRAGVEGSRGRGV